jgi:hypothetical protein
VTADPRSSRLFPLPRLAEVWSRGYLPNPAVVPRSRYVLHADIVATLSSLWTATLDALPRIREQRYRIEAVAAEKHATMPPPYVPLRPARAERELLARWIACGAPQAWGGSVADRSQLQPILHDGNEPAQQVCATLPGAQIAHDPHAEGAPFVLDKHAQAGHGRVGTIDGT